MQYIPYSLEEFLHVRLAPRLEKRVHWVRSLWIEVSTVHTLVTPRHCARIGITQKGQTRDKIMIEIRIIYVSQRNGDGREEGFDFEGSTAGDPGQALHVPNKYLILSVFAVRSSFIDPSTGSGGLVDGPCYKTGGAIYNPTYDGGNLEGSRTECAAEWRPMADLMPVSLKSM